MVIDETGPKLKVGSTYMLFLFKPLKGGFTTQDEYYCVNYGTKGVYSNETKQKASIGELMAEGEELTLTSEFDENEEISAEEIVEQIENVNETNPVDEEYRLNEYKKNLEYNRDNKMITQEDYERYINMLDQYAKVIE